MVVYVFDGGIRWYWFLNDFRFKWLKYGKDKLLEDIVVGEYINLSRILKNVEKIFVMDWFNIRLIRDVEKVFYEYCLVFNKYILSIIWED